MNQLIQYTPSVYFHFDDTANKTNFSNQQFFQLSCTNQKNQVYNNIALPPKIIELEQEYVISKIQRRLKTDQFFQEFENNFIVTFDEDLNSINREEHIAKTSILQFNIENSSALFINNWSNVPQAEDSEKAEVLMDSFDQLNKKSSLNQFQNVKVIESSHLTNENIVVKEKNSPVPSFEIKKRTTFKNKENIVNNQQFKITKKKILNQNTLSIFLDQTKSCVPSKRKHQDKENKIKCLTSKIQLHERFSMRNMAQNNFIVDNKYKSDNIFIEHKQFRESFRSITLNNWKRKLNDRKKSQDKTNKRQNIFATKEHITLR